MATSLIEGRIAAWGERWHNWKTHVKNMPREVQLSPVKALFCMLFDPVHSIRPEGSVWVRDLDHHVVLASSYEHRSHEDVTFYKGYPVCMQPLLEAAYICVVESPGFDSESILSIQEALDAPKTGHASSARNDDTGPDRRIVALRACGVKDEVDLDAGTSVPVPVLERVVRAWCAQAEPHPFHLFLEAYVRDLRDLESKPIRSSGK